MNKLTSFIYRYKAEILLSFICFIVVCCSSTKPATLTPAEADVSIAQAHWAGTTLADLNKGYSIFADKCTDCHGMKKPQGYTEDDWTNDYMPTMGRKAKLSPDEYTLVLHYILTKREELTSTKK